MSEIRRTGTRWGCFQRHGIAFVSPDVVTVEDQPYRHYLSVKDPDGHAVQLVQR